MAGSARMDAGVPSRLLPPWLETEIAVTPASTARSASSTRITPLSMNGPSHCSRSQRTSSHVGISENIHSPYAPKNVGASSPGLAAMFGTFRSGGPPLFAQSTNHCGRESTSGANFAIVCKFIWSGIAGLPQSRPKANVQSVVRIRPTAPASRARSSRRSIPSLPPSQYDWKKVCGLASTTSSTGLLANALRPIAVPRAAVARATATSPSGWTACTPVGETITGIESGWPITSVERSRSLGSSATCGAKPSSPNALRLSSMVSPFSEPATSAMYTDLGSRFFALRCASATVSNHAPVLAITVPF